MFTFSLVQISRIIGKLGGEHCIPHVLDHRVNTEIFRAVAFIDVYLIERGPRCRHTGITEDLGDNLVPHQGVVSVSALEVEFIKSIESLSLHFRVLVLELITVKFQGDLVCSFTPGS